MKRKYRLRHSADFRAVSGGRKGAGDHLLRIQLGSNGMGRPRVGVVAPKRLGGAVVRNRIRRRVRAEAGVWLERLGGMDLVVLPKPASLAASPEELRASLARVLRQCGVGV